jgi:N-acetylglucosaminyldiphosphoundecaprenol N-acetyl-beta-D-mannosaminyltransferase
MSLQNSFPKYSVLGIEIDRIGISQALDQIESYLQDNQRSAGYIVKPYVEFMVKASKDTKLKKILNDAYLCLPDGVSLNWAVYFLNKTNRHWWNVISSLSKIIFKPLELHLSLPNHAWATNFTWSLLETCAKKNFSVYLVGSPKKSHIKHTANFLTSHIPNLKIVGLHRGKDVSGTPFSDKLEKSLLSDLKNKKPDIILVGLGFPRQEKLIANLSKKLTHGLLIGEGGTFDFHNFGGRLPKAPIFMQAHGLEWAWRLLIEPKRLRRQLSIPKFVWQIYHNRT